MAVAAKKSRISEEVYFEMLAKSELKLEYWAGTVVGMAGASSAHCEIEVNLIGDILQKLQGKDCRPYNSNLAVFIPARSAYVFPDLSVVCGKAERTENRGISCLLNPTVLVEVISPSTSSKDETHKLLAYTTLRSVREYLIVYADQYCVKMHARTQADEIWSTTIYSKLEDEIVLASCGVKLTLASIYQRIEFLEHAEDGVADQGSESQGN